MLCWVNHSYSHERVQTLSIVSLVKTLKTVAIIFLDLLGDWWEKLGFIIYYEGL